MSYWKVTLHIWLFVVIGGGTATGQVIYQKPLPTDEPGRYKIEEHGGLMSEDIIEALKKKEEIYKLEIRDGKLYGTVVRDLKKEKEMKKNEAEEAAWRREFFFKYAILEDIGPYFKTLSGGAIKRKYGTDVAYDFAGPVVFHSDQMFETKDKETAWMSVHESPERPINLHDFLRRIVRGKCSVRRSHDGKYVKSVERSEEGTWTNYGWRHKENVVFYIYSLKTDPKALAERFLKAFPSSLPNEFEIDQDEWGREEVKFWLDFMKQNLKRRDSRLPDRQYDFSQCVYGLAKYVVIPPHTRHIGADDPFERKLQVYNQIDEWWKEHGDKSYWHRKHQLLVAKGQSPEELVKAEENSRKQEIKEILEAPISKESMEDIRKRAIEKFEAQYTYLAGTSLKSFGPDCGAKFERQDDGSWLYVHRLNPELIQKETLTGPVIEETRDRPYPLKAVFTSNFTYKPTSDEVTYEVAFFYDKLRDKWLPRRPGK